MKILIQGGGIAGLALAVALNEQGIYPTVIERADDFHAVGYWVYIYDNGRKVLRRLGLESQLDKFGHPVAGYEIINLKGQMLHHMDFAKLAPEYIATTSIERPHLHGLLLAAVDKRSAVQFGTSVVACDNRPDGVDVTLNTGATETYDLVVAADGIHSFLRSQVFPDIIEKTYGMYSWLLSVDEPAFVPNEIVHRLTAGSYAVQYPHGTERAAIYLAAKIQPGIYGKHNDGRHDLAEIFKDYGPPITDIIADITDKTPMFTDYIKKVEHNQNYQNRIAFTGDAEHAMSPLLGQGSSLAMEDSFVLAEELVAAKLDVSAALSKFHDRRGERVHDMQRLSNIFMGLMTIDNNFEEELLWETVRHFAPPSLLLDIIMRQVERPI